MSDQVQRSNDFSGIACTIADHLLKCAALIRCGCQQADHAGVCDLPELWQKGLTLAGHPVSCVSMFIQRSIHGVEGSAGLLQGSTPCWSETQASCEALLCRRFAAKPTLGKHACVSMMCCQQMKHQSNAGGEVAV